MVCIIQLIQPLNYSVGVQLADQLRRRPETRPLSNVMHGQPPFNSVVSRNKELNRRRRLYCRSLYCLIAHPSLRF